MIRLLLILLAITVLSMGAAWVANEPGRVIIDWNDYHIEMSLLAQLTAIAVAALLCLIVYTLIHAIVGTPRSWMRSRLARHQTLGLEALTAAFAAIATQDVRQARKQIWRAQQYLPHQPLTLMLASQVARLEGNESQSRLYLEQMLKTESTEFIALRGLIENARRSRDDDTALIHAEKALTLKSQDPWLVTTLTGLYTAKGRTDDALRLLDKAVRKRTLSRQEQNALAAGVLYEQARPLAEQKRFDLAIAALKDALRHEPSLTPASALLADIYVKQDDISGALKIIANAWKHSPHPLLTQALMQCYAPPKTRKKVGAIAEKLAHRQPEHRESRFLLATLALKGGSAAIARNEIRHLIESGETIRTCTMMAEAENALGNTAQSADWLKRAASALSDPGYACDTCHQSVDAWRLTCPHCGSVGSITWK